MVRAKEIFDEIWQHYKSGPVKFSLRVAIIFVVVISLIFFLYLESEEFRTFEDSFESPDFISVEGDDFQISGGVLRLKLAQRNISNGKPCYFYNSNSFEEFSDWYNPEYFTGSFRQNTAQQFFLTDAHFTNVPYGYDSASPGGERHFAIFNKPDSPRSVDIVCDTGSRKIIELMQLLAGKQHADQQIFDRVEFFISDLLDPKIYLAQGTGNLGRQPPEKTALMTFSKETNALGRYAIFRVFYSTYASIQEIKVYGNSFPDAAEIGSVNLNESGKNVTSAAIASREYVPVGSKIEYFLSNDGLTWHSFKKGESFSFPSPGQELRWKIVMHSDRGINSPEIESIQVFYYTR